MKSDKFVSLIAQEQEKLRLTKQRRIERFQARKRNMDIYLTIVELAKTNAKERQLKKVQNENQDVVKISEVQVPKRPSMWNNTHFYNYRDVERMSISDNLRKIAKAHVRDYVKSSDDIFYQREEQPTDVVGEYTMNFRRRT